MAFTKATIDYLDAGGLINWQTTAKTSAFTAVSGEGYLVDTTSAAITVTLPTAPSAGDEIIIVDYASNAGTNNITLDPGTLNLRGATDDLVLDNDNQTARLLYSGATKGWLVTTEAGAGTAAAATPALTVDYLVVAGGGAGQGYFGGGGGAGGLRTSYTNSSSLNGHTESTLSLDLSSNYTVTVGPGGAADSYSGQAANGTNSQFSDITSTGGGGSAQGGGGTSSTAQDGGSGGGGASSSGGTNGGSAVTSPVTQGFDGGDSGYLAPNYPSAGGGGAGAVGGSPANASVTTGGSGGVGLAVNIISTTNAQNVTYPVGEVSGSDVYFAGGGGGAIGQQNTPGSGGTGGGGTGCSGSSGGGTVTVATNGTANTGGGAGGGSRVTTSGPAGSLGTAGGSGVVILRYSNDFIISETTTGGNVLTFNTYTEGSDKVTVFTSGANGTIQFST